MVETENKFQRALEKHNCYLEEKKQKRNKNNRVQGKTKWSIDSFIGLDIIKHPHNKAVWHPKFWKL